MKYLLILIISILPLLPKGQSLLPEAYYRQAAENSAEVKASFFEYEAALAAVEGRGTLPPPEITFGYFLLPIETRLGPQRARLSAMQMFPWKGTLSSSKQVAAEMAKAKYEVFRFKRDQVFSRLEQLFLEIWEIRAQTQIIQEQLTLLERRKRLADQRMETGSGSMVDVLRISMLIREVRTRLENLAESELPLQQELNLLCGIEPQNPVPTPDSLIIPSLPQLPEKEAVALYQVKGLEHQVAASRFRIQATENQGKPGFGLGVNYFLTGQRTDMDPDGNGRDAFLATVSLKLPIYRSKYRAEIQEQQILQLSLQEKENKFREDWANTVVRQKTRYEQAKRNYQLADQQINELITIRNLLINSYQVDGKRFDELLETETQLLDYQMRKIKAEAEMVKVVSMLKYLEAKE